MNLPKLFWVIVLVTTSSSTDGGGLLKDPRPLNTGLRFRFDNGGV